MSWTLGNTLYVVSPHAWLNADHETLRVEVEHKLKVQLPFDQLAGVVIFGDGILTPASIGRLVERGIGVTWLDRNGRFVARAEGPVSGNVLLRRAQHQIDEAGGLALARAQIAGKLHNCRAQLLRSARDAADANDQIALRAVAEEFAAHLRALPTTTDPDSLRGHEGLAARAWFGVFGHMVLAERAAFTPDGRSRRPPLDRMNALLSFLYALLTSDCVSALESAGLDPQVGWLHVLRPGRPGLALDLMEPLRPLFADRLALTLVNRRQIGPDDFEVQPSGAVRLTDSGRTTVLAAWQERKREVVTHPALNQEMPAGLVPLVQARLLARAVRGDPSTYTPFVPR